MNEWTMWVWKEILLAIWISSIATCVAWILMGGGLIALGLLAGLLLFGTIKIEWGD